MFLGCQSQKSQILFKLKNNLNIVLRSTTIKNYKNAKFQLKNNKLKKAVFFFGFKKFPQVFKCTLFWVYFQFKVKFKVKYCVNQFKPLKRYFKATLNVFFNKKKIDDENKKIFLWCIFGVKSKCFYLTRKNCLKFQVFQRFLVIFVQLSCFFCFYFKFLKLFLA